MEKIEKTAIQLIKEAASKLQNKKLKNIESAAMKTLLDKIAKKAGLGSRQEAIVFTALFERTCEGRESDIDDLALYFGCSHLEMVEYLSAIQKLCKNRLLKQDDDYDNISQYRFIVSDYVFTCLVENKVPDTEALKKAAKQMDRYEFITLVHEQYDRLRENHFKVATDKYLRAVKKLEEDFAEMPFVVQAKKKFRNMEDRALFYEICNDFRLEDRTSIPVTLKKIYGSSGQRYAVQEKLNNGTHPVIKSGFVDLYKKRAELYLTPKGQQMFLGADYDRVNSKYTGLNRYGFASAVYEFVNAQPDSEDCIPFSTLESKLSMLEEYNKNNGFIENTRQHIPDIRNRTMFYMACHECAEGDALNLTSSVRKLFPHHRNYATIQDFKDEKNPMQVLGLAEIHTESSFFGESTELCLTAKGKKLFFEEEAEFYSETLKGKDLIKHEEVKSKNLFFPDELARQLTMVENSLQQENYLNMVARMEKKAMPKGISILLYGMPGTGKTESVMQWARSTGRDIFHVDISASKSMWYGESEKRIKRIFDNYREYCEKSTIKPILLFNEADAIFSTRKEIDGSHGGSVDQTENAIQNIILEEMENLDGILVATTNLTANLDKAFERRFLFKIKFDKPTAEAKRRIWRDKLPALPEAAAARLASQFDFSGGEIDNIVRKATMQEVIDGREPTLESLTVLCNEEKIGKQGLKRMGFKSSKN